MSLYDDAKQTEEYKQIVDLGFPDVTAESAVRNGSFYFQNPNNRRRFYVTGGSGWVRTQPHGKAVGGGDPRVKHIGPMTSVEAYQQAFQVIIGAIKRDMERFSRSMTMILLPENRAILFGDLFENPKSQIAAIFGNPKFATFEEQINACFKWVMGESK